MKGNDMWRRPINENCAGGAIAAPTIEVALETMPASRAECLEQILEAFCDIADRDDIHQAADRLALVQNWIKLEAAKAAADPLFADFEPAF
ncbi:MAG TPA: hypothetical protein VHY35_04800 [Stellaceae bacterium]|nr:hypothetical protein [Stellaceae bacterium]